MFGFLDPRPHSSSFRRVYARLCQHQHRLYGLTSLPFHSYEAAFLFQCAVDAGAVRLDDQPDVRCCRLSTRGPLGRAADAAVGRFCASFALLLASIKLADDVADDGSLPARLGRWLLHWRLATARRYFARLAPDFETTIGRLLAAHAEMELRTGHVLADYVGPTAEAFGFAFGLMAAVPGMEGRGGLLSALGRHVGAALIAFDCAVDWRRDRWRGHYNPLDEAEQVYDALAFSAAELSRAARLTEEAFGPEALSSQTLQRVRDRVLNRDPLAVEVCGRSLGWLPRARHAVAVGAGLLALPFFAAGPTGDQPSIPVLPPRSRKSRSSSVADLCCAPTPGCENSCAADACWLGCQGADCCEGVNCGDCNCDCSF